MNQLKSKSIAFLRFIFYFYRRFSSNSYSLFVAGLTYISLVTIVPALAFVFALAQKLNFHQILAKALNQYINSFGKGIKEVFSYITTLIDNSNTTTLGILGLLIAFTSALKLMTTIEKTFNIIFKVEQKRAFKWRIIIYLALIIISFFLVLSNSIFLHSSYINKVFLFFGLPEIFINNFLPKIIFLSLSFFFFVALYLLLPNARISWKSTFFPSLFVTFSFFFLQFFFTYFQIIITSQSKIYGAFSIIPFFLLWLYLSWFIILIGADLTANLQKYFSKENNPTKHTFIATEILLNMKTSKQWKIENFLSSSGYDVKLVHQVIKKMQEVNLITSNDNISYQTTQDISLDKLEKIFNTQAVDNNTDNNSNLNTQ